MEYIKEKIKFLQKSNYYFKNSKTNTWNKYTKEYKDIVLYNSENLKDIELVKFDKPFKVYQKDTEISEDEIEIIKNKSNIEHVRIDTSRKYYRVNEKQIAAKNEEKIDFQKLILTSHKSKIRAIKSFFDYARNNKWEYFCTFTFKENEIRNSRDLIVARWKSFVKELQKIEKNVKVIAVVEEHEKGGYHLHALVKDILLPLIPAINNNKESKDYKKFVYTNDGNQIFNLNLWKNGFSTVAIINQDDNNNKVINYCSKYIVKNVISGYCKKSFFRTNNLEKRNKRLYYSDETNLSDESLIFDINEYLIENNLAEYKKIDEKLTVYKQNI